MRHPGEYRPPAKPFRVQNVAPGLSFPMRYTDIAIIGAGLAGSTAAAMLGRVGIATVLIDPHRTYPFDFRVEKISGDDQLGRFYQTGIADSVLPPPPMTA